VGFLTGVGAVILVGVATQGSEAPAATRDIYMVHTMFRREFAALPTLVRGVAAADAERVDLIAEHTGLLTVFSLSLEVRTLLAHKVPNSSPLIPSACTAHPPPAAPCSAPGRPEMGHSSRMKFRSIRRRNSNDS
jgi:hypothetical protein